MKPIKISKAKSKIPLSIHSSKKCPRPAPKTHEKHAPHTPVLLNEVVDVLRPKGNGIYIDATFGLGGHTLHLLGSFSDINVIAFDRDPLAIDLALKNAQILDHVRKQRLHIINEKFSQMASVLPQYHRNVDGILMDVGISSLQIDTPSRGFSYKKSQSGPLDMRMNPNDDPETSAYHFVNTASKREIANVLWKYGEERRSIQIAERIVAQRNKKKLETTWELSQIVNRLFPIVRYKSEDANVAKNVKKIFQAIRIHVNRELDELNLGLRAAETLLAPDGVLAIISFNSLEDRMVKKFMANASGKKIQPEICPDFQKSAPTFYLLSSKPITPSADEMKKNSRSKPAKLRYAIRTSAPSRF